jgi:hypothetical protein
VTAHEGVSIAVVPRDRFSVFRRCLEALYAHTDPPFRVLVVAGGMNGTTHAYLDDLSRRMGNMTIVSTDNLLTQAEARNIALRHIRERLCVILENDTLVHDDWLRPLLGCMRAESAAVVAPLITWYRGVHAAGCTFEERDHGGRVALEHRIGYTGLCRRRIDYPECHCILIDRDRLSGVDIFDDVEPFDVDLGLTLRKRGLPVVFEPGSVATYAPSPPLEVHDVPVFKFRWDAASWETRNRNFMKKWRVVYDPSSKIASYRRQQLKLGLARVYPSRLTVRLANVALGLSNRLSSSVKRTPAVPADRPLARQHERADG